MFHLRNVVTPHHPLAWVTRIPPGCVPGRTPPCPRVPIPRCAPTRSSQRTRRINIAKVILPRTVVGLVSILVTEPLPVLKVIGHKREDLVVGDPLILLTDAFGLRRFTTVVSNREAVEVAETLGGPAQVEY